MRNCGKCHYCGTKLQKVMDGEEWCPSYEQYRRYDTHGFKAPGYSTHNACPEISFKEGWARRPEATCEEIQRAEQAIGA